MKNKSDDQERTDDLDGPHRKSRLVIVSNRLPIVLKRQNNGKWAASPGSGGLVTALEPVIRDRGGLWIGWPGTTEVELSLLEDLMAGTTQVRGFELKPVSLSAKEVRQYYRGFSNQIIWPLFHDLNSKGHFDPSHWDSYKDVNRKFALTVAANQRRGDYIWVQDYHLMNVGQELRRLGVTQSLGFFLHIPFPPLEVFLRLPWRYEILNSLLYYDLIGFQTRRDLRNFIHCARNLSNDITSEGKGQIKTLNIRDRSIKVGTFPISIDYNEFSNLAITEDVSNRVSNIRSRLPNQQIILGVDRLDYSKGIPDRLEAFRKVLLRYPELQEKVVFVQVVVPSRVDVPEYNELKIEIERLVGEINGELTQRGWVPIQYLFRSLNRTELVSWYRAADMAMISPLKDGMNLIAKEFCACSPEENSVLILSEFAGAASQLHKGALLINPYDVNGMAEAINKAFHMPLGERKRRMKSLRSAVRRHDIFWWVNNFLEAGYRPETETLPHREPIHPSIRNPLAPNELPWRPPGTQPIWAGIRAREGNIR